MGSIVLPTTMPSFTLSLGLEHTHVLITGGAGLIGAVTVEAFLAAGARVSCVDVSEAKLAQLEKRLTQQGYDVQNSLFTRVADISDEQDVTAAFAASTERWRQPVQCCVALAAMDLSVLPHVDSIIDMDPRQFKRTHEVNVYGTFLTARTWLKQMKAQVLPLANVSLIMVGSESGLFGERGNADYASSKSAVQGGLLHSLQADVPRTVPGAR